MKQFRTLLHAMSIPWLMAPQHAAQMAMFAFLIREGKLPFSGELFGFEANETEPENGSTQSQPYVKTSVGNVAIHTIEGSLMRADQFCGPEGMQTIGERIMAADASEEFDAHVIRMHTPGGTVEGTETLANIVATAQKPIIVHGEMMLSGGAYIASGADHIMLAGKNAEFGSIGVQISYLNFRRAMEKEGIDFELIRATNSQDKNRVNWLNLSEDDRTLIQQEMLDPVDQNFMNHVRTYRPGVSEEALTGKVYMGEQAIELGLADDIGTFQDAVGRAIQLAQTASSSTITIPTMSKETIKPQAEAAPTPSPEATEDRVSQMLQIIDAKDAVISAKEQLIKQQAATIAQLQAEVKRLAQMPATDPEAAVISPAADASTVTDVIEQEESAPQVILDAINHSRRREASVAKFKPQN